MAQVPVSQGNRILGEDLKTVQFGCPLGMPLVRKQKHACDCCSKDMKQEHIGWGYGDYVREQTRPPSKRNVLN